MVSVGSIEQLPSAADVPAGTDVELRGLDLRDHTDELCRLAGKLERRLTVAGCLLTSEAASAVSRFGGRLLQLPAALPFDPFRTRLYTPAELLAGCETSGYSSTVDARVHEWLQQQTHELDQVTARALHDDAMDSALTQFVAERPVVGLMGGHALQRTEPAFRDTAWLAWELARAGNIVATEGGPGAMEAANLGAYLSCEPESTVDDAVRMLGEVPDIEPSIEEWVRSAERVRRSFAPSAASLGIAPWFNVYGQDPPNLFTSATAKYLVHTLQDYGVLGLAGAGLVFLPGAAGTIQEIFEAVTNSYYLAAETPIVLVGRQHWTERLPVWNLLTALGRGRPMAERIHLVDDVRAAATILLG